MDDKPKDAPSSPEPPSADDKLAKAQEPTLEMPPVAPPLTPTRETPAVALPPTPAAGVPSPGVKAPSRRVGLTAALIAVACFAIGAVAIGLALRPKSPSSPQPAPEHLAPPPHDEVAIPVPPPLPVKPNPPHRTDGAVPKRDARPSQGMGVLRTYETGDVAAAQKVAQSDHATALLERLTALQKALDAAANARRAKDLPRELASLESAAQLDASIDRDPGPVRTRINGRLVDVSVEAGDRALAKHDLKAAAAHYRRALELAPARGDVKRKLARAGG